MARPIDLRSFQLISSLGLQTETLPNFLDFSKFKSYVGMDCYVFLLDSGGCTEILSCSSSRETQWMSCAPGLYVK